MTTVAYQNPYTDEWVGTERFDAPASVGRVSDGLQEKVGQFEEPGGALRERPTR